MTDRAVLSVIFMSKYCPNTALKLLPNLPKNKNSNRRDERLPDVR